MAVSWRSRVAGVSSPSWWVARVPSGRLERAATGLRPSCSLLEVVAVVDDAGRADLDDRGAGLVADAAVADAERPGPFGDGAVAVHPHALDIDAEVAVGL